jgi:hypothetical protein
MKNIVYIVLFQLICFNSFAQNYDGEKIFINSLSIESGGYITENQVKTHFEYNSLRSSVWGVGINWNEVIKEVDEDDYFGTSVTSYSYNFIEGTGFLISIVGKPDSHSFVTSLEVFTPKIVMQFLNHKFIIGSTKKSDVASIFVNGKIDEFYGTKGSTRYKVYTHGGTLSFIFRSNNILDRIYLESF